MSLPSRRLALFLAVPTLLALGAGRSEAHGVVRAPAYAAGYYAAPTVAYSAAYAAPLTYSAAYTAPAYAAPRRFGHYAAPAGCYGAPAGYYAAPAGCYGAPAGYYAAPASYYAAAPVAYQTLSTVSYASPVTTYEVAPTSVTTYSYRVEQPPAPAPARSVATPPLAATVDAELDRLSQSIWARTDWYRSTAPAYLPPR